MYRGNNINNLRGWGGKDNRESVMGVGEGSWSGGWDGGEVRKTQKLRWTHCEQFVRPYCFLFMEF